MITENLSTLKIHKLTQEQYDRELNAGNIDESALYLTPYQTTDIYVQNEEPIDAYDGSLWVDIDEVGSGNSTGNGSLPSYSTANNGQILTVVNGTATWQTIDTWAGGNY